MQSWKLHLAGIAAGKTVGIAIKSCALASMSSLVASSLYCRSSADASLYSRDQSLDGKPCRAGSKAAVLGRRRAIVGARCTVSRRA